MKFRIVSHGGDGVGLARLLATEGHEVSLWLEDADGPDMGKGVIDRVDHIDDNLTDDTIIVFDMSGNGEKADEYRARGFSAVGGSMLADKLELDRAYGIQVAKDAGIAVPESKEFTDFAAARDYIDSEVDNDDAGFVFKPNDNKEGVTTFVSTNAEQMLDMLATFEERWKGEVSFVLQKVVDGVEISSEVWCVKGEIVPGSYNNTLEQKKFMPGNLSKNTGCMGSTVQFNMCPKLFDLTLAKLAPWLKKNKYTGPLDINCIVDGEGTPWFLEWTPRFGYSAIYAMVEGLDMPLGDFLEKIAKEESFSIEPSDQWCGALRITMPPYPMSDDAPETKGMPLLGFTLEDEDIWPLDVMEKDGKLQCSGFDGIVCEVSAYADSPDELWAMLYERAQSLIIPEMQYRTDNLQDVEDRLWKLAAVGLIGESDE
jgi:phosphoribosylamine-glycine ligase